MTQTTSSDTPSRTTRTYTFHALRVLTYLIVLIPFAALAIHIFISSIPPGGFEEGANITRPAITNGILCAILFGVYQSLSKHLSRGLCNTLLDNSG